MFHKIENDTIEGWGEIDSSRVNKKENNFNALTKAHLSYWVLFLQFSLAPLAKKLFLSRLNDTISKENVYTELSLSVVV